VPSKIFNVAIEYANQIVVLSRFVITDENLEFSYLYSATSVHMRGNVQTMIAAARILGNALKNINASEDLKEKAKQRIEAVEAIIQHQ
jgi:type VI protein secretion system component VasF